MPYWWNHAMPAWWGVPWLLAWVRIAWLAGRTAWRAWREILDK